MSAVDVQHHRVDSSWSSPPSTPAPGPARTAGRAAPIGTLINVRNPATGTLIAQVRPAGLQPTTSPSSPRPRRPRPPGERCRRPKRGEVVRLLGEELRRAQDRPRHAGLARERQDPRRGPGRSAGDDRHRRLRRRPVAHALRPHHALRAPRPPHVRAVASARRGRHHLGLQLPGRGVGLERLPRPRSAATSPCGSPRRRRR